MFTRIPFTLTAKLRSIHALNGVNSVLKKISAFIFYPYIVFKNKKRLLGNINQKRKLVLAIFWSLYILNHSLPICRKNITLMASKNKQARISFHHGNFKIPLSRSSPQKANSEPELKSAKRFSFVFAMYFPLICSFLVGLYFFF